MKSAPKVSIVIPIYNVEKFIERSARSLFEQTCKEIEYIFVNDCTPDASVQVLEKVLTEYPERKLQVVIIHQERNGGVAAARNLGLDIATGEYTIQSDSDDWVEPTMIEELYFKAKENDSDVVWSDFYVDFSENSQPSIYRKQEINAEPIDCINAILKGKLHGATWNKIIKRSFCVENNIRFPDGVNMCEDLVFVISCFLKTKKISYLPKAFYHYVQNEDSITLKKTLLSFESEFMVVEILTSLLPGDKYQMPLLSFKGRIKKDMLFLGTYSNEKFISCYPECTTIIYDGLYGPKGKLDKAAIWFALKKQPFLSQFFISLGQFYLSLKRSVK